MIRRARRPDADFLLIRNDVVRDSRLSYRARGLLCAMLSYPDDWRFDRDWLAGQSAGEGQRAVRTALQELERCGYLRRQRVKLASGRFGWEHVLYDTPQDVDVSAGRTTGQESTDGKPPGGNAPSYKDCPEDCDEDVQYRANDFVIGASNSVVTQTESEPPADWRAADLAYFCEALGPRLTSDGSRWTKGEWETERFYAAFRKGKATRKGPIKWPGLFLEHLAGVYGSGVEDWLTSQGLEES